MAIRFMLMRNAIKSDKNFGKFFAHTVKNSEVTLEEIEQQIQENCTAKAADVKLVMKELFETIKRAMQDGHVVNLGELGKMYIAVKSIAVNSPADFRTDRHITGFRCKYTPFGRRCGTSEGQKKRRIRRAFTENCIPHRILSDRKNT
ncbi:MAG: hypothetical protein SOZ80_08340 [Prevotella sp.]|uniref:HU family DNA-binding protein n=1 Tax=Prevotella sp. TaxID=59823 RepID=UPI002A3257FF|nr:hypothetical protein [Prevotella sp.]MDD7318984.1 hypothetical protein [Prevotellaceae bacterium]MDY4020764.1 hypothetical protein [Prevotella sp.]